MKARHPSARTGGTRYSCQFSARWGPVALRSWGEFGRATFPSRGHLVRCHHRPRPALATATEQSCPINRWLTQPNRAITRHSNLAILGRHPVALGLRQRSHFPPCPRCCCCSFCRWVQHIAKTDAVRTTRHRTGHCHPPIAIRSATISYDTYAQPVNG